MKHFSEADWADFVRKLVSPKGRIEMQQHLNDGCKKCQKAVDVWQAVRAIAGNERNVTPPVDTVRVVKSQFTAAMPHRSGGARLVFDSMLQPLTAGIRGSVAARQFLYETEDYYIDLRLVPLAPEARASVVGQVLSRTGKRAAQAMPVRLQHGKRSIAQTSTNQFGEFHLEFEAAENTCILLGQDQGNEIILPLYGVHVKPEPRKGLD